MPELLTISTEVIGHRSEVIPSGEIDLSTSSALAEALRNVQSDGGSIRVDLSDVSFIDSTGLRILLDADAAARSNGHTFSVVNPSGTVYRALEITGVLGRLGLA
jgi:anti-sigma B factor antagonist